MIIDSVAANLTCEDVPVSECPLSICTVLGDKCVDRLRLVFHFYRISFFILLDLAAASEICACTQTGISGGNQTGVIGCRRHPTFPDQATTIAEYCYVNGGAAAQCPCSKPSPVFEGAAYRLCATGIVIFTLCCR
jgi:hypothetical protein